MALQITIADPDLVKAIAVKARGLGVSNETVVLCMIAEFTPSTPHDRRLQQEDRHNALHGFLASHPKATVQEAWQAGYRAGWALFQSRKANAFAKFASWRKSAMDRAGIRKRRSKHA
jgi:hypothetical protein